MRELMTTALAVMIAAAALGCEAKATDEQIDAMCKKKLELQGISRGTSEAEAAARISEEYRVKKEKLEKEMARDLKGRDDVYALRVKDIEDGNVAPPPEPEVEPDEAKGPKKKEEEELSPEQQKELLLEKAKAQMEKGKKEITDQFERLIETLGPQGKFAVEKAKKYARNRKKEADTAQKNCLTAAKKKGVDQKLALCRTQAKTKGEYGACKR